MRILLADPHYEVRTALRWVLEQQIDICVIGEAQNTIELFAQITSKCPDIVLLDPDLLGEQTSRRTTKSSLTELLEIIHNLCPASRVIRLSSQPGTQKDPALAETDAFFCKSDPPDALLALLQQLLPGNS